jgi:hypothetical protein
MTFHWGRYGLAISASLVLHGGLIALAIILPLNTAHQPNPHPAEQTSRVVQLVAPAAQQSPPVSPPYVRALASALAPVPGPAAAILPRPDKLVAAPLAEQQPASMAAPAAPTDEEWTFAARYTLKNSKGYRHSWGQQVRSMMGTAVTGPNQGMVRFRIEIAPDGTLAKLETLWRTSEVAERLARQAVAHMPRLPPPPSGKALIFDKTIQFSAFASDDTPFYKDDCLPDPPAFGNRFAWDGRSPQRAAPPLTLERPDPQAMEKCQQELPQDTIEAESAHDRRALEQWGPSTAGR